MTDHRLPAAQPSASPRSRRRFALTGHSTAVDPRVEAARGDLADVRLADRIFAPHYAAPVARTAVRQTPLLAAHGGAAVSELLQGERFDVLELSHGYAWGVGAVDGVVGFVAMDALGAPADVTHIVCIGGATLPMGTRLTADQAAAFDPAALRPLEAPVADYVASAEILVGTLERDGGRSSDGVNCTGLVFLTLSLAGIRAPRFADLQARKLGHAVSDEAPLLRGDLLYYDDHVAIVADETTAIHVDGGAVVRTPVDAITNHGPLVARRRLP